MAAALLACPTFALLSNDGSRLYLHYATATDSERSQIYTNERLEFSEQDVNSPTAKFQAESAVAVGCEGLVHIKCLYMNTYLRRASPESFTIHAGADQPDEDPSSWSCTLFEPQLVRYEGKGAVVRLFHVQLKHYAMSYTIRIGLVEFLYASTGNTQEETELDMFTVIDLERIELPSPFVMKSNDNGGYLRCLLPLHDDDDDDDDQEKKKNNINHEILQFSEPDRRSRFAKFQLEQSNNSDHRAHYYVHIKSLCNNKYLRRMDCNGLLIVAAADQPDENKSSWTCTLFKPEHVEPPGEKTRDNKVLCRIRHAQTDLYTRPFVGRRCELQIGDKEPDPDEVDAYTIMPCTLPS